ncbi:T9SS type A sorting domain-containing protein [Pontibacter mucosus]|nr:T9SS type A sorting domain-containing protein [Pontibacter mucosus]
MSPNNFLKYLLVGLALLLAFASKAQEVEWDKTYGGEGWDLLRHAEQTTDGGYILGGISSSGEGGEKSDASKGEEDYWIVKIDSLGNKEWDRILGGSGRDELQDIKQTRDGGYILGGYSLSDASGDKSEDSRGGFDYWVVKLDASGNKQWDRTFGGDNTDQFTSLQQTGDGGYILGGSSESNMSGEKSEGTRGRYDYWVIRIDSVGNKLWDKTYGGNESDFLNGLQHTNEGGYILGGSSESDVSGEKSDPRRGNNTDFALGYDFWIVKIDSLGNKEWDKTLGGLLGDYLSALIQTQDGGFMLGGTSGSGIGGDKSEEHRGGEFGDYWVVKTDSLGNKEWDRTYGGNDSDELSDIIQTNDGGYLLGGESESDASGEKSEDGKGRADMWVVKIDSIGNKQWDKTIGGENSELLTTTVQDTITGGYLLAGSSTSGISGDKSEPSRGGTLDYWIVKLSPEAPCTAPTSSIAVVPASNVYTGGPATTIYLGYGPQRVQLVASGAERYAWSPAAGLNDASIANPVFTPNAPGTYRFTVTAYNGTCSSTASVEIEVIDVRCGNNKVTLCHRGRAICIPPSAVAAHLKHHPGDQLGACGSKQPDYAAPGFIVFPNPINSLAEIVWTLQEAGAFRIELYNANGLFVKQLARGAGEAGQEMQQQLDASRLPKGVYYLRLITSDEARTIRLVVNK